MSDVHVTSAQQVVLVEAEIAQQVVLVEVEVSQGPPGPQGPAGPELPPPGPDKVGMAALVRDYGAGPVWDESFITPSDVHDLGDLATMDTVPFDDVSGERTLRDRSQRERRTRPGFGGRLVGPPGGERISAHRA